LCSFSAALVAGCFITTSIAELKISFQHFSTFFPSPLPLTHKEHTMTNLEAIKDLVDQVHQGKLLDAFEQYYAEDVSMQEGEAEPTVGKDVNREREKAFVASIAEVKGAEVLAFGADGDVTFYESTFDFVNTGGEAVHFAQVAVQRWRDGKIVSERFCSA
jgi:ketosteroid isomerase-like protein